MKEYLRELPATHILQNDQRFIEIVKKRDIPLQKLTEWIQGEINEIRNLFLIGEWNEGTPSKELLGDLIFKKVERYASQFKKYHLKRVINGTGTILHTNLGRARLSKQAIEQIVLTAENYSNLEYDIEKGRRGSRSDTLEAVLKDVTGAEAAMAVNNNAAAVYLILRALAHNKEVIVSRGQLVEIGGSFRVSSIMEESGAKLVEVGTTNKTHLYDYEQAINEETAMIMKVHTSNFKTIGFTESVSTEQLVNLSSKHREVISYEDLGSGALYDFQKHGIGDEPVVSEVLRMGVDLVSFSGDKLLGGPQAGIIAGKKELINKLKKHQLARALRVDKMTMAALEATIKSYIQGGNTIKAIPTVRDILTSTDVIKNRVEQFINSLEKSTWYYEIQEGTSQIGGGTMPDIAIPTIVVALRHNKLNSQQVADCLRAKEPAVISRIKDDQVLLDFRTITEEELPILINCFRHFVT